jgi:hypothetical protein
MVCNKYECVNIHHVLCWETSYNGQLVQCYVPRHYLTAIACPAYRNKTVIMVDGDGLVTTLPLAYVSCCIPNLFARRQSKNVWQRFCDRFLKRPLLTVSRSFMNVANHVLWRMAIILKANQVNLFVSSVLFVLWYHSPNFLDTPHIWSSL